jgi:hypothetical protein
VELGVTSFSFSNSVRVRRDRAEAVLIDPIRKDLLSPDRTHRMANEMQFEYVERIRATPIRLAEHPKELRELLDRIQRLRHRLKRGDPDMTLDEIQAAIERAEAKAQELQSLDAQMAPALKVFTMLPRAAEAYRRQIALGLEGEPRATLKARSILRDLFGRGNPAGSRARWRADSSLEPAPRGPFEGPRVGW